MPCRHRGRSSLAVRGAVLALAGLFAPAVLGGCKTAATEAPDTAPGRLPDVAATRLASDLGLTATVTDTQAMLESRNGTRIFVFPGTAVASVAGTRIDLGTEAWASGSEVWLSADDAALIRSSWTIAVANGADVARGAGSGIPDGPSPVLPPPPSAGSRTPRPAGGANAPTAAEVAAWSVPRGRAWKYIVLHHSASPTGSAAAFDKAHRAKGWEGLGYHFVIGNGTGSRDGQIEVGFRWRQQREGAHARVSENDNSMNEHGIGICLVGDFTRTRPTPEQMRSLSRLCSFLGARYGLPPSSLRRHGDVKRTDCPGRYFPRDFTFGFVALGGVVPTWTVAGR